ncbi:MAG: MOSC domain-containing protein [Desulfobacterales bacterium]|nr:MAG: MOSC domain-containing protein [Desulfobacterales bacterium]
MSFLEKGNVVAVSIGRRKGEKKTNIRECRLVADKGLENDAHAGNWHRQVSLLAMESIVRIKDKGIDVQPGDFAENITTKGLKLWDMPIGALLKVGQKAILEVTQIGKACHDRCAIYHQVGDCVMPREGIFARVIKGGMIKPGDAIKRLNSMDEFF